MIEISINKDDTTDDLLWKQGSMKENGSIHLTWPELTTILNESQEDGVMHTESYWRKRFRQMKLDGSNPGSSGGSGGCNLTSFFLEIEKQRIRARDERTSYNRMQREQAREDAVLTLLKDAISAYQPPDCMTGRSASKVVSGKTVYAMLSDVHYGIAFESSAGKYDSGVAAERIMRYADEIIRIGKDAKATECYVSLMGDMISGTIHTTIRVENRENLIEQVVGVSELVAAFLHRLAGYYDSVIVNSVDGNHSRTASVAEDALRAEKLDALIPWYCKTKLANLSNVQFQNNALDSSIGTFSILGKTYVCVHGDMDGDLKTSAQRIESLMGHKVDYLLAGHMHVADCRIEHTGFIRNGSVCGSGDEYTMKKRLFGPPVQVCLVVSETGVDAIHPVRL